MMFTPDVPKVCQEVVLTQVQTFSSHFLSFLLARSNRYRTDNRRACNPVSLPFIVHVVSLCRDGRAKCLKTMTFVSHKMYHLLQVHRVLKPGAPFITTVWQPPPMVDIFGNGLMKMMITLRETGKMPMPDPAGPPPANPCNLANSVPDGPLGDALTAAG